jgi:cytochrome P450
MTSASDEAAQSSFEPFGDAVRDEMDALTSEEPQALHAEKLQMGIEEMAPGMVALRRMGDIQALTRSHDVRQFGADMGMFEGAEGERLGLSGRHVAIPLELDGAEHTRWRKILDPVFTPKKVAVLEPRVRDRANELIDTFIDRGEVDAYVEWCEPLPSSIFLSIMGIPVGELAGFLTFKNTILGGAYDDSITPESRMAAFDACDAWFAAEFDRRDESGEYGEDLIGWLMTTEIDGRRVNRDELHGICNLLMIAGLDTVAASLACILARLARHPGERAALLGDPAKRSAAIEELMRFESPVTQGFRHVVADVELPSGTLKSGTNAIVWWAAANVDPEAFDDPLTVDFERSPNPHICFASGWHRCLGSHLARMELRAALDVWHARIPDYRIAEGAELTYSVNPRAPHHLPLVW